MILYLSDGTGDVPTVPDVIGLTEEEATEILEEIGYEVLVFTKPTSDPDEVGIVLAQTPKADEEVAPPAQVVIQVGMDRDGGGDGGDTGSDGGGTGSDGGDTGPGNGNGRGRGGDATDDPT